LAETNITHFNEILLNYNIFKIERDDNLKCTLFHMEMNNFAFHIVYKINEFGVYFNECCMSNRNGRIRLGCGCNIECPLEKKEIYEIKGSDYGNIN